MNEGGTAKKTAVNKDKENSSGNVTGGHKNSNVIILLAHTKQGKKYKIENINGGHCLNSRLNSMGIVPGDIVKVIHQGYGGPMTLAVKGVRIALGRGIAHKIEVSEQDQE
jgi:ferrous iron transport protein A